jgi:hypothetical protein
MSAAEVLMMTLLPSNVIVFSLSTNTVGRASGGSASKV